MQVFAPGHCKVLADFVQGSSLTEFRATSVKRKKDFSGRWKPQLAVTILHKILLRTGRRWEFYSNTFEHMANMFQIRYVRDQYLQDSDAPGPDPQEQNVYRTVALVLTQSCDQQQYFSRSCANVVSARRTSWCVFPAAKAIAFALPGIITTCWPSGNPRAGIKGPDNQKKWLKRHDKGDGGGSIILKVVCEELCVTKLCVKCV